MRSNIDKSTSSILVPNRTEDNSQFSTRILEPEGIKLKQSAYLGSTA